MSSSSSRGSAAAERQIDECMLRDRFALRRALRTGGGKGRDASTVRERIARSQALVESRRASVPTIRYPDLPVAARADEIRKAIAQHQVLIVAGETGSGKTTQLPKMCLEAGRGVFGQIGHTQPRRVAARSISHRLAEELGVKLGEQVGYQVRFTDESTDKTLVKVMTDGVLLAEIRNDKFLERYDTIIIDEAHERSLNIDFLLGYLKRILPKRPDLRLIITSATIDVERFSRHFGNAPVIEVSGRTYPVELQYRPVGDDDDSVTDAALDALREIATTSGQGDVLVFLPGEREIRDLSHAIRRAKVGGFELLPLYARLGIKEQARVFAPHSQRRIVLATNVAETSITVPNIRYVIDPGLARMSRYSHRHGVQRLPIEPISQASANQRMGRCGRVAPGVCYRLYSEEDFEARPEFTTPEIRRTNLAAVILQMLVLRLGDIERFPFVERPESAQVTGGFRLLFELGAVDDKRNITPLGRQLARLPIDLRLARMLLAADVGGCLEEVTVIASGLAVQDPRERPLEKRQAADAAHREYDDERSDFTAYLNLWRAFENKRQELSGSQLRKHCQQNFLSYARMREWREVHRQLLLLAAELGLSRNRKRASHDKIHRAILAGLLGHVAQRTGEADYTGTRGRAQRIFPASSQFGRRPRWIVSAELVETSRLYAHRVAELNPKWIEPLAGHLVQRRHYDPFYDAERGQALVNEEVSLYGLVIEQGRRVDYAAMNPEGARELFIRKALIDGELKANPGFFTHNRRLVQEIERMESRARRRDLLVGDDVLFDFYDERLPADLCTEFDLLSRLQDRKLNTALKLQREELLRRDAELPGEAYPTEMKVAGARLKLDYRFEPGDRSDGVTVDVPLALLSEVPRAQLDWMVPGMLREKCLALLRSLPKPIRRRFVPAPEYVDRALKEFEYDGRELTEAFAERLFRMTGNEVRARDFNTAAMERHLSMNIRVKDDKGKVVDEGRDLDSLLRRLAGQVAATFEQRESHAVEASGLTDWPLDQVPETVTIRQGGVQVQGHVAIVDQQRSVDVRIRRDRQEALRERRLGTLRLFMLRLPDQVKYLAANVPGLAELTPRRLALDARWGGKDALVQNMIRAAFDAVFIEGQPVITRRETFEARFKERERLFDELSRLATLLGSVLPRAQSLQGELARVESAGNSASVADIRRQINGLFSESFPFGVPRAMLEQYPRYFKALEYRVEKLVRDPARDVASLARVEPHLERLAREPEMVRYRWLVEEYRVSVFAQQLGTREPVSEKRLNKLWQQLTGEVP